MSDERPDQSDEFLVSREALDEAYSALAGCLAVLGDTANISHAMSELRTAQGNLGDHYDGHNPQFVIGGYSQPMPEEIALRYKNEPLLGLATNTELQAELDCRKELGHTHPDYKSSGYDGPVA